MYHFKKEGYKHTNEKKKLVDKTNHTHTLESIKARSKSGELNPMFNKTHSSETKKKRSFYLSKTRIGLYNIDNKLIKTFVNQVELAAKFGVFKTTIHKIRKTISKKNNIFEKSNKIINKFF